MARCHIGGRRFIQSRTAASNSADLPGTSGVVFAAGQLLRAATLAVLCGRYASEKLPFSNTDPHDSMLRPYSLPYDSEIAISENKSLESRGK
jgi:hypothetical protein